MDSVRAWLRDAFRWPVVRRALVTSLVVGTLLTVINHADYFMALRLDSDLALPVLLTYLIPYAVATVATVGANRSSPPRDSAATAAPRDREAELLSRVPGQNPNPVLRMRRDGRLVWANESSLPLREAFGTQIGETIPDEYRDRLLAAADRGEHEAVEVAAGVRTFSVLPIAVPEAGLVNIYGTDITGAKVVERFPERNPNPVMRMSPDGMLLYANEASAPVVRALGLRKGEPLPAEIREACLRTLRQTRPQPFEVSSEGRTFAFTPVHIPEFDFVNMYGTDITAIRALDKFPDRNPNPVMRVSRDGLLTYANPASAPIRSQLGIEVGEPLPAAFFADVQVAVDAQTPQVLEVVVGERTFELLV